MFGKTQKSTLTSIHGTSGSGGMLYGSHECLAITVAWQVTGKFIDSGKPKFISNQFMTCKCDFHGSAL